MRIVNNEHPYSIFVLKKKRKERKNFGIKVLIWVVKLFLLEKQRREMNVPASLILFRYFFENISYSKIFHLIVVKTQTMSLSLLQ